MNTTMGDRLKAKLRVKQAIEHHLYGVFDDKLKTRLHDIIDQNNALTQNAAESFMYKGIRYVKDGWKVHPSRIKRLHPQLDPFMDQWLLDLASINDYERPVVMGYVQNVLNSAKQASEYLVLFPTALCEPFKEQLGLLCEDYNHVSIDQAESLVPTHEAAYTLLKTRLMMNMLGVD
jgi:hypothetical protein